MNVAKERDLAFLDAFIPSSAKWLSSVTCGELLPRGAFASLLFVDMNDFVKMTTNDDLSGGAKPLSPKVIRSVVYGRRRLSDASALHSQFMRKVLKEYFCRLTEIVGAYDGSVVAFLGDAILVAWFVDDEHNAEHDIADDIFIATKRANSCAQSILDHVHGSVLHEAVTVHLKLMVSSGRVTLLPVWISSSARAVLVFGEAMDELRSIKNSMESGKVVLSSSSQNLLRRAINVHESKFSSGFKSHRSSRLVDFIPSHVVDAFKDGLISFDGMKSVNCVCTVAFIRFQPIADDVYCVLACVHQIHRSIEQHRGTMLQIVVDEIGHSCLCAFGLHLAPKRASAKRGVRCVRQILALLQKITIKASCGVSTGAVNFGSACVANSARHSELTLIGVPVILAARLAEMSRDGSVALDEETLIGAAALMTTATFVRKEVRLKGFERAMSTFVVHFN